MLSLHLPAGLELIRMRSRIRLYFITILIFMLCH